MKKNEELSWIDLSYANGWQSGGKEERIVELIRRLKYKVEDVSHSPRGTDTEYICEEARVKWHADSSG